MNNVTFALIAVFLVVGVPLFVVVVLDERAKARERRGEKKG